MLGSHCPSTATWQTGAKGCSASIQMRPNKRGERACKQNVGRSKNPASPESCSQRVNTTSPTLPVQLHQSTVPQPSLAADHPPLVSRSGYGSLPRPQVLILKVSHTPHEPCQPPFPPLRSPNAGSKNRPGPPRSVTMLITPPTPAKTLVKSSGPHTQ